MNEWTSKDFRKAAFAVGFGFVVGKALGKFTCDYVREVALYASKGFLKWAAENDFESAQEWCRKLRINYGPDETDDDEPKMKMGFC